MKNQIIALLTLFILVCSCQKEEQTQAVEDTKQFISVTCSLPDDTKTEIKDNYPYWAEGDLVDLACGHIGETITHHIVELHKTETVISGRLCGVIAGDKKSFTVNVPVPTGGMSAIFAVYPYCSSYVPSLAYDKTTNNYTLTFNIPSEQDGTFAKANIQFAHTTANPIIQGGQITPVLNFRNAASIIKIDQSSGQTHDYMYYDAKSIIAGEFVITFDGSTEQTIVSVLPKSGVGEVKFPASTTIQGKLNNGVSYFAVGPATSQAGATLNAHKKAASVYSTKTYNNTYTFQRSKIYSMPLSKLTDINAFTVSSNGDLLVFAPGNVYYNGTKYAFEENQYDFRTDSGIKQSRAVFALTETTTPEGTKGLFTEAETINAITALGNQWTRLSAEQRTYLFETRTCSTVNGTANAKWAPISVGGVVGGILIFPDTFKWPEKVTNYPKTINAIGNGNWDDRTYKTNYGVDDINALLNAGCVFLPASGYNVSGTLYYTGYSLGKGYYRTASTENGIIFSPQAFSAGATAAGYGCSIRPVKVFKTK